MNRYKAACSCNTRKAMTLYRYNLRLSQEMFTIISCFEVALRNTIDRHYVKNLGSHWLKDTVTIGGRFEIGHPITRDIITNALNDLGIHYTHSKLVAAMDFGFWRYMFAPKQYRALGQTLMQIFPCKPLSTPGLQYNQSYVFNILARINTTRNRIAHHEPICFQSLNPLIGTTDTRQNYYRILQLFQWMNIDEAALLYGLDHIITVCNEIDAL